MTKLTEALILAATAHDGQLDKQGEPYIFHPMRVANVVRQEGEIAQIVAILHDVVEDTDVTLREIYTQFGEDVCYELRLVTRAEREETYKRFIERATSSRIARLVKRADILDHMSRIDALPLDEQARLRPRYVKALSVLS